MKNSFTSMLTVAIVVVSCGQFVRADIGTLQELVDGAELVEGTSTYNNFSLVSDDGSVSPDLSQITVSTISRGLEFASASEFLLGTGLDTLSFQVSYDVISSGQAFRIGGTDLSLGAPQAGQTGVIDLFAEFTDSNDQLLATANSFVDPFLDDRVLVDTQRLATNSQVGSLASFTLFAEPNSSVSVNSFRVLTTVPEPASASILSLFGAFALARRRRSRSAC